MQPLQLLRNISLAADRDKRLWVIMLVAALVPVLLVYYAESKECVVLDCHFEVQGLRLPTSCQYVREHQEELNQRQISIVGQNTSVKLGTTTLTQHYECPDCPICMDKTYPTTQQTSTTSSTTTSGTTLPEVIASGGDYYSTKPSKIDFKYQMCNPFENVSVPLEYIVRESEQSYNYTYLNGTTEIRYKANETKYKIIKGGCILISANCCRCQDGGTATPINAKYYKQYYEDVLGGCNDKPVVCPMIMRSP